MNQKTLSLGKVLRRLVVAPALIALLTMASSLSPLGAETDLPHPTFKWRQDPGSNDWNTAANWFPEEVPDTSSEAAEFGSSTITDLVANATVNSIEFHPGADQYTITGNLTFNAGGVINNSGLEQTFNGTFRFQKFGATVGPLVTFTTTSTYFLKGTSGGSGTYINNGTLKFFGGYIAVWYTTAGNGTYINNGTISFHKADAGSATFTNNGGATFGADGGVIEFNKSSDAGTSTIINNGGAVFGGHGSRCTFHHFAGAAGATLIANGGAGPGSGAAILFAAESSGDTARVEVFGNGNLDISREPTPDITIGSLEGDGLVFLGANKLLVGANDLDTSFAGTISDEGGVHEGSGGAFAKTGAGTLSLTNANAYTGGTTVEEGALFVNNSTGSGTGDGAVVAEGGTLGGSGTIAGPVTVGSGSGPGAVLSPGASAALLGVFTLQDTLSFGDDGNCDIQLDSTVPGADQVAAQGVSIAGGATISLADLGSTTLSGGTSFVIINNTGSTAIAGTFANLPDGGSVTVGSNTYVADYEGGDGNDLTLTVTP